MPIQYPRQALAAWLKMRGISVTDAQLALIGELADVVFFASLATEEGEQASMAVVYHQDGADGLASVVDAGGDYEEPDLAWQVTQLSRQPFTSETLARLSRGLEYGKQLVVVGGGQPDELTISGIARRRDRTDGGDVVRFAAPRPGTLVLERQFRELFRFECGQSTAPSLDVLGGDGPVRNALGEITKDRGSGSAGYSHTEHAVLRLLREMRSTEAGAILAFSPTVPASTILDGIRYRLTDGNALSRAIADQKRKSFSWLLKDIGLSAGQSLSQEALHARDRKRVEAEDAEQHLAHAIEDLARLSAVDGAILAGPGLEIYGAGHLIPSGRATQGPIRRALKVHVDGHADLDTYDRAHGARHNAAVAFVDNAPGGVAFVVSEDGPISCVTRIGEDVIIWSVQISET